MSKTDLYLPEPTKGMPSDGLDSGNLLALELLY